MARKIKVTDTEPASDFVLVGKQRLEDALCRAFAEGFSVSGEGHNSEYPYGDDCNEYENDPDWVRMRDQLLHRVRAIMKAIPVEGTFDISKEGRKINLNDLPTGEPTVVEANVWTARVTCTGHGNGATGCGSVLQVRKEHIRYYGGKSGDPTIDGTFFPAPEAAVIKCPQCGVLTDMDEDTRPKDFRNCEKYTTAWQEGRE